MEKQVDEAVRVPLNQWYPNANHTDQHSLGLPWLICIGLWSPGLSSDEVGMETITHEDMIGNVPFLKFYLFVCVFVKAGSLTGVDFAQESKLAGQGAPGTLLSPSIQYQN